MSLFKKISILIALIGLLAPQVVFAEYVTDFRVTVSTDKENYDLDDNVEITMQAENYTKEDTTLNFTTGCQMGLEIFKDEEIIFSEDMYPRNCSNSPASVQIPDGKKAVWTRTIMKKNEGYPFDENARYRIHGYIMDHEDEDYSSNATSFISIVFGEEFLYAFNDIYDHWGKSYIQKLNDQKVIEGYDDGGFHPNDNINRAEMVKLALTAAGYDLGLSIVDEEFVFEDLDEWQRPCVYQAWKNGIVAGYDDGTFAPAQNVTRAEAIKIAMLAFNVEPREINGNYAFDDTIDHWAASYINEAYVRFIVAGRADGNFYPNEPITRAEAAKIISKLIEL
ncbi:S-layer homology domain-containing protein [Patescibacteria group bacterium]